MERHSRMIMESRIGTGLLKFAAAGALGLFFAAAAMAQAPAGPQPGPSPAPANPAPAAAPKPAAHEQKPQEPGATIAVEVPVVTLDVIDTTQHGDLLTGLKKENFRV